MIMNYILIVLFAVLAIVFLSGKGSWLIAGYNVMSDDEKQKYNYKRLCCVMGVAMMLIDACLIISCATDRLENLISILMTIIPLLTIILANTICRKN